MSSVFRHIQCVRIRRRDLTPAVYTEVHHATPLDRSPHPAQEAEAQHLATRELSGWGPTARSLCRVIRLCLRSGVGPVFIPKRGAAVQRRCGELHPAQHRRGLRC
jgi:hypothetical protein